MVNIVIPMAGAGSRFSNAGFSMPKPFIDVNGKPMIVRVLENLRCHNANYILIARRQHADLMPDLVEFIKSEFSAKFVFIDDLTEGTACSILRADELINNNEPLLVANSDQILDFDFNDFIQAADSNNVDGSILVFVDESKNPKWSFASLDSNGFVNKVEEKNPISEFATVGIYYFRKGSDFVKNALKMIIAKDKVNGEFYTAPVYNYLINDGMKISAFKVHIDNMHGIGTPEDLETYIQYQNKIGA